MVLSTAFNALGTQIVSASKDGSIRIWDVETGLCVRILEGNNEKVYSAAFNGDGSQVV